MLLGTAQLRMFFLSGVPYKAHRVDDDQREQERGRKCDDRDTPRRAAVQIIFEQIVEDGYCSDHRGDYENVRQNNAAFFAFPFKIFSLCNTVQCPAMSKRSLSE